MKSALLRLCCLLAALVPAAAAPKIEGDPVVDEKTEAVIKGALKWLASKQLPNGAWGLSPDEQRHPIAITGYTLIAFQSAGQLPGEGEFGKNVTAGMQYLLDAISPEGLFLDRNSGQYMYGHGIASIALAELYGQTRSPAMRPKFERVIKLIISAQNREGGWRYRPVPSDADISVTVLQAVALRAAKNAGLDVPQATLDAATRYVRECFDEASGGFTYQPKNRAPGFARTAAAIYSLQVLGHYDDPLVKRGADYLVKHATAQDREKWFTYGNFYAAPAMYMIGGDLWRKWYAQMKETLLRAVTVRGDTAYWEPKLDPGNDGVGPVYATAVYTMILAMPYHYLPLYQR
ncbi:MAG TPA: prenyltransferase/squalene oxidase repeat-containing protein [Methylomirabilota bacterium]|nr:prenyltransferase/squalene oxidase repeat-containing protein [Methylomirabilota bacterium]